MRATAAGRHTHEQLNNYDATRYVFGELSRCPICGSADLVAIKTIERVPDERIVRRTRCRPCGHRFYLVLE